MKQDKIVALEVSHTPISEHTWRLAEHSMARRERLRLVRLGVITPVTMSRPTMMVKNADGSWSLELKIWSKV